MDFTLHYRGELKSNGSPRHKQALRRQFHPQLKQLWKELPLSSSAGFLREAPQPGEPSVIQRANGFNFASLVCKRLALVLELEINILWPQPPGAIVSQGGDIDNRLKTLLDSLRAPIEPNAVAPGDQPGPEENPFFVLLEDDRLITRITVDTAQLLEPNVPPSMVE